MLQQIMVNEKTLSKSFWTPLKWPHWTRKGREHVSKRLPRLVYKLWFCIMSEPVHCGDFVCLQCKVKIPGSHFWTHAQIRKYMCCLDYISLSTRGESFTYNFMRCSKGCLKILSFSKGAFNRRATRNTSTYHANWKCIYFSPGTGCT